jgi:hypothetical protein
MVSETESSLSRTRRQREEAARQPLIQKAIEMLGAEVLQADDGFGVTTTNPERAEAEE